MSDTPRIHALPWLLLAILGMFLSACNFFNPSGTGSYPSNDPDVMIDLGQRALQRQDFNTAWTDFSQALALDSNKSLAYQGLAKAEMGRDSFKLATLVWLADTLHKIKDEPTKIDFLTALGLDTLNHIYHPLMRVAEIYRKLQARDAAGRTDGVFGFHLVKFELEAITSSQTYFQMIDANGNWVVEPSELRVLSLLKSFTSSGKTMLNADSLKSLCNVDENGRADTAAVNSINGILNNLTRITQDTQSRTQTASSIQSDPNSATSKVSQQSLDFIAELGASTSFYLINDNLDNDGDGCINEEIYGDSTDNDGDSLKEEDGRIGTPATKVRVPGNVAMVSPTELSLKYVFDPVNNKLLVVPRIPDDLTWGNSEGLLTPYLGLRWVRWDEHAPSHNDTIFARVVQNETGGAFTPETVKDSPDYEKIRTLAIIEIRKKVLAQTDAKKRIQLGKLTVGGCWDAL